MPFYMFRDKPEEKPKYPLPRYHEAFANWEAVKADPNSTEEQIREAERELDYAEARGR